MYGTITVHAVFCEKGVKKIILLRIYLVKVLIYIECAEYLLEKNAELQYNGKCVFFFRLMVG